MSIGNKIQPFKMWCQKVLPTVYDDSLSYYECLIKLTDYLNQVIDNINALLDSEEAFQSDMSAQWTEYKNTLTAEWTTYKNYIDNYFTNLNVQTEINNKLDAMAQDGSLDALIQPYVNSEIASQVAAWLTSHVDPVGSAVVVDDSLSIEGAAADAKTVGDLFADSYLNKGIIEEGTDLDDITYNSVYQISDAVAPTLTNWAWDSLVGVLITNNFYAGNNVMQMAVAYSTGYTKYRVKRRSGDTFVWTNWRNELDNYYKNMSAIPENTDVNDIVDNSVYQITSPNASTISNWAFPNVTGILITDKVSGTNTTSQLAIRFSTGTVRYRMQYDNAGVATWSDWSDISFSSEVSQAYYKNMGLIPSNTDLNDINENCIYQAGSVQVSTLVNYPSNSTGVIITNKVYTNMYTQLVIADAKNIVYGRRKFSSTWTDWVRISFDSDVSKNYYINKYTMNSTDDVNDIKDNSINYAIANSVPSNYPLGSKGGLVISSDFLANKSIVNHFVLPHSLIDRTQRFLCARYFQSGSWKDWKYVKLRVGNHGKDYYAFGDSTTWGYSSNNDHAQSQWNYPAIVGDLIDINVVNYADPAQGLIKNWDTPTMDGDVVKDFAIVPTIEAMINNGDFDNTKLITVGWAYNDGSYYSSLNFGSPSDPIPASTSGITTFLGYYAKILDILQRGAPTAQVILITGFGRTTNTEGHKADDQFTHTYTFADGNKTVKQMYDALEEMANLWGYPCINQAKGCAINYANANTIIGDNIHPTYDNYRIYGNNIASRILEHFHNI